jgi:hypothetical protein
VAKLAKRSQDVYATKVPMHWFDVAAKAQGFGSHIHETFEPQFRADIVNGTLALWTRSHVMPNLDELSERDRAATDSVEEFKHGTVQKAEYFDPMGR